MLQETTANELAAKEAKMLRFAAHLGLALADLDIIPHQHMEDLPPELEQIKVHLTHLLNTNGSLQSS